MTRSIAIAALSLAACANTFGLVEVSSDARATPGEDGSTLPTDLILSYTLDDLTSSITRDLVQALPARCLTDQCPAIAAQGHTEGALEFDGTNDMLQVDTTRDLATPTGFTASAWVRLSTAPFTDTGACIVGKRLGSGGSNSWQLCLSSGDLVLYSSTPSDTIHAGPLPIGEWHHVAGRWDGTTKSIWLDGLMKASSDVPLTFDAGQVLIGADVDIAALIAPFPGLIDEVRLYSRALTADEMFDLSR